MGKSCMDSENMHIIWIIFHQSNDSSPSKREGESILGSVEVKSAAKSLFSALISSSSSIKLYIHSLLLLLLCISDELTADRFRDRTTLMDQILLDIF